MKSRLVKGFALISLLPWFSFNVHPGQVQSKVYRLRPMETGQLTLLISGARFKFQPVKTDII